MTLAINNLVELLEETEKSFSQDHKLSMDERYEQNETLWVEWNINRVKWGVLLIMNLHEKLKFLESTQELSWIDEDILWDLLYETEQMYNAAENAINTWKFSSMNSLLYSHWYEKNYLRETIDDIKNKLEKNKNQN